MGVVKKAASHVEVVIKWMIFIGFTIQIALGIGWMCCNFMGIQDFGEPGSSLYRGLFGLLGENPQLLYLLQLAFAFYVGCRILRKLGPGRILVVRGKGRHERRYEGGRGGRILAAWGSLALLTFPFAMQCHLAVLPCSFMGSFFLLMLSFLMDLPGLPGSAARMEAKRSAPGSSFSGKSVFAAIMRPLLLAFACVGLLVALSGAVDGDGKENAPKHNFQSAMASRMAWPDIWNDLDYWSEDLQEMAREVLWETSYYPGNMDILLKAIEDEAGAEAAKDYYMQIARVGWNNHAYMVILQIGWDALGYVVTPAIFQLQLKGDAYDSFTGRNYEVMRGNSPVLTKHYVDYGCWWFGCSLALALLLALVRAIASGAAGWKKWIWPTAVCALASAVLAFLLTMRGAGLMDYKYTVAVNELWLMIGILLISPSGEPDAGSLAFS